MMARVCGKKTRKEAGGRRWGNNGTAWHGMAWTADGKPETFRRRAREVTGRATSSTADAHFEQPTTTRGRVETKQRSAQLDLRPAAASAATTATATAVQNAAQGSAARNERRQGDGRDHKHSPQQSETRCASVSRKEVWMCTTQRADVCGLSSR